MRLLSQVDECCTEVTSWLLVEDRYLVVEKDVKDVIDKVNNE